MNGDQDVPFFTAVKVEEFSWPVKVPVPKDGKFIHATFTARFKYLEREQLDALLKEGLTDRQLAEKVLVGIEQLQGEGTAQLRREAEVIRQVLDVDRAPSATFGTYMAVISGLALEKN